MREQLLFYFVFLGQVLLVSLYFPHTVLRRMKSVLESCPPSEYPRLYPKPVESYTRAHALFRVACSVALIVGLGLVVAGLLRPEREMLGWDDQAVVGLYFLLQTAPFMMLVATSSLIYFSPARRADRRTRRSAELRRRRLSDFVSPGLIEIAVAVYLLFVGLVIWVRELDLPWFAGFWNVVAVSVMNVLFAWMIYRSLYGTRQDPFQATEDRDREIGVNARVLLLISILGTLFIALNMLLQALDLSRLVPMAQSVYFQIIILISMRELRIEGVDFEVYKEDPQLA